jgi:hypothetical protein
MTEYLSDLPAHIQERFKAHPISRALRRRPKVYRDTSNFSSIDYSDIIAVDQRYFLVTGHTVEGRFGVDDQIKQWVPKTVDLETGNSHILKLVFHETFNLEVGGFAIRCYRSPEKEARVLEHTRGNPRFMQGYSVEDEAGNLVRILDVIRGRPLDKHIYRFKCNHEEYYHQHLPALMQEFLDCARGIAMLHANGFRHGDVRRDHILVEYGSNHQRWIDFDYDFHLIEHPFILDLHELAGVLLFLAGKGDHHPRSVSEDPLLGQRVIDTLSTDDLSLLNRTRIVNLRKIYPYISKDLNKVLMHFSQKSTVWYDTVDELIGDIESIFPH